MYVPDRVVTNDDLASLMDTSDEWIQQRTGIHERHWVEPGQQPSELAQHACERALEQADLEIRDIDCILLATLSSEHDFPGTSFFLHERLRAGETPCIDLRAQCSGFLYALDFGDGAGAVILEANDDPEDSSGILQVRTHAEGRHARRLWVEAPASGGTPNRLSHEMLDQKKHYPYMEGRYVFKHAVTRMPEVLREALSAASIKLDDVSLFLFHQANLRINEFVAQKLELPEQKIFSNIQRFGNCSAASIPMLMAEASSNGLVEKGQIVSLTAFGSGFTWGSAVLRW